MIHKLRRGWPIEFHDRWTAYEAGMITKMRLEEMRRECSEFNAFIDEQFMDWKARNSVRMNERFDDPWGGM